MLAVPQVLLIAKFARGGFWVNRPGPGALVSSDAHDRESPDAHDAHGSGGSSGSGGSGGSDHQPFLRNVAGEDHA